MGINMKRYLIMRTLKRNKMIKSVRIFITLQFILIFMQLNIDSTFAQVWIENNITKIFKNELVYNSGFENNTFWAWTSSGLFKIQDNKINIYLIDSNSTGDIENSNIKNHNSNYISSPKKIIIAKDKIWLIPTKNTILNRNFTGDFFMIKYDTVFSLKLSQKEIFQKSIISKQNYILLAQSLDENGNLYIIVTDKFITKDSSNNNRILLLKSDGENDFEEIRLPDRLEKGFSSEIISIFNFRDFIIYNNYFLYIVRNYSDNNNEELQIYRNDSLVTLLKLSEELKKRIIRIKTYYPGLDEYSLLNPDKNIYFLISAARNDTSSFYLLKMDSTFKFKIYNIDYNTNWSDDFDFIVKDDYVFFSTDKGFFKYNLNFAELDTIKEKFKEDLGLGNFHNVFFGNFKLGDSIILGNYTNLNTTDILLCNGIYFYKYK